jgi:ATP-dependent helicase/nuclease subunit B
MLQAFRLRTDRPTADYDALRKALHERASPVPRSGGRLDGADVWLGALAQQGVLLAGTPVVRNAFPGLHQGLLAMEARGEPAFGPHHGRITARPGLDPRGHPEQTVSVQRLETLGTCPLRYLLRYVLGVSAPERADLEADRWLTPLERGAVLHRVFQRTLEQVRQRECDVADAAFETIAIDVLEVQLARMRERVPPPGDAVYAVESETLRQDVLAFVQMTRARGAPWVALELRFGEPGNVTHGVEPPFPVRLNLPGGRLGIAGRIDRVDRTEEGIVVIDYKTGGAETFGRPQAVFWGGRRLQHVLYALAAKRRFPDDRVVRAEFHFPTHRGETRVRSYAVRELREGGHIVDRLLDLVRLGHFTPTDTADDCRWCDYRTTCRVRDENGRTISPLAEWAQRSDAPELHVLRGLRRPIV